jgi:bifunctional DNA-binding transcriptional regulator/antitoxin component of YhaV-PrlF toxin-antitoxin module
MVRTTVQISKDSKWRIVLPEIVRKVEELQPGDFIEIDIRKIDRLKVTA